MSYDWYSTCPKCKHIGWCDYKGKANIFKGGPGSDTYKVLIYKCKNCGRKFGFSSLAATFQNRDLNNEEEDNNLKSITEILDEECTHDITRKHDSCCSSLFKTENKEEDDSEDWKEVYYLLGTIIDNAYVPNKYLISAFNIARKHCRCDS